MRLIIVSNRLPITINEDYTISSSIGGLAKGLIEFLNTFITNPENSYLWIGWTGVETIPEKINRQLYEQYCYPVSLDGQMMDKFYNGFCNQTIWPIFHSLTGFFTYDENDWHTYQQVNYKFAEEIIKIAAPEDIIWIHDYHLFLVAYYLKQFNPNLVIGFFLHIPFPAFDTFQFLPKNCRTTILEGMTSVDMIGFHTYEYAQNFVKCATRMLGYESHIDIITTDDHLVKVGVFPMGINFNHIQNSISKLHINKENAADATNTIRRTLLSIDRLDYTKGINNRLLAYDEFLTKNPEWHKRIIFNLIIAPSREKISCYQKMKSQIDELVGNINGRFGCNDWVPINYQYKSFDSECLLKIYADNDIALVTPIIDGMNLIAKEYIAAKVNSKPGVLILSETAGAAKELVGALIINPNSIHEIAEAIKYALSMPETEKAQRLQTMQYRVKRYTIIKWGQDFIKDLFTLITLQNTFKSKFVTNSQLHEIKTAYDLSKKRALILDYDGTLVPLTKDINLAVPTRELIRLLEKLSIADSNTLIIISGRERGTLDKWLTNKKWLLIAEHGAVVRLDGVWATTQILDQEINGPVLEVVEAYSDRVPGSLIERKEFSLAWHYRNSDPESSFQLASELFDTLITLTANSRLQVLKGNKVIEVRPINVNKGIIAKVVDLGEFDFILAMGDDTTDEDMFRSLPEHAVSVRIGSQASSAKFNIVNQKKAIEFIQQLVE